MSARQQALEALVEAHARELHLPTVRARFRPLAAEAAREQQTPIAYLAALLEAEVQERAERRERRRLIDARFPLLKRLEDFRFQDNPNVPQATIAALAEGLLDRRPRLDHPDRRERDGEDAFSRSRLRSAPASRGAGSASPRLPGSRTSCRRPSHGASSPASSAATPASSCSSSTRSATSLSPRGRPSSSSR